MDRSFLYGIVVLLSLTDTVIYIQKTNPNLIEKFVPSSKDGSWQSKDPGWNVKPDIDKKEEKKDGTNEKKNSVPESEDEPKADTKKRHHFRFFR